MKFGPNIVTSGLVFNIDPANPESYVSGSSNTFNLLNKTQLGSLLNDTSFSTDNAGIWNLDGNDERIDLNVDPSTLGINNYFSEMALGIWFKTSTATHTGFDGVIRTGNFGMTAGMGIYVRSGKCRGFIRGWNYGQLTDQTINDGKWHYAMISKQFYFDGQVVTTGYNTSAPYNLNYNGETTAATDGAWLIGYQQAYLEGSIGPLQIYNRNLSATEVLHNYNALKGRFI